MEAAQQAVASRIRTIRGLKVIFGSDLAELYGVPTKALNQAVRRNPERFPDDFCFQLTEQELRSLRSQIVTLEMRSVGRGKHLKYTPYAFTEQGVAMLSSVLKSSRAAKVNVEIMRVFVRIRGLALANAELTHRLNLMEAKYDRQFKVVFDAIREMMTPPVPPPKRRIGFVSD